MHIFVRLQKTPQVFLHDQDVLEDVITSWASSTWVPLGKNHDVPVLLVFACAIVWPNLVSTLYTITVFCRVHVLLADAANYCFTSLISTARA